MPLIDPYPALARHALFQAMEADERARLLALGIQRRFAAGQLIFQRGDPGNSMMLVQQGLVKISILSEEGKELTFAIIRPGECFGEIALLDGQPRSADATAVGRCTLFIVQRQDFVPFLERYPHMAIHLTTLLCQRVRAASLFTERLAFESLATRLARLLMSLAETQGVHTPVGILLPAKLPQQEIGHRVASSRESVNKQLRAWRSAGLLTVEQGHLVILQPALLKRLAHPP